jgi:hypothetical protein
MKRLVILAVSILFVFDIASNAQSFAVKSNALYLTTATLNVGLECSLAPRWTFEFEGGYKPWTLNKEDNMKAKHWLVSPEFRYWFCEAFQGHFVGINGNFTQFNTGGLPLPIQKAFITISPKDAPVSDVTTSRMEGWAVGAGITYGYAFPIARRWNLEFTAGFGWWYTVYEQYESRNCGLFQQAVQKHVLGPTALGISFIYMIK